MKALLKIEAIGENTFQSIDRYRCFGKMADIFSVPKSYWVAKITGFCVEYDGLKREFVKGNRDYAKANSKGTRGIYVSYFLDPGVYEVKHKTSWKHTERYFCMVTDGGEIIKMDKSDVEKCLLKKG